MTKHIREGRGHLRRHGRQPDTLWFTLRLGNNTHRSLQDAFRAEGAGAFTFEILERLEAEGLDYVRDRLLQERLMHWADKLQATRI